MTIRLEYADDGTTLTVRDYGPGAPVMVGAPAGYGLTGMRERAELLGGRLTAEPTADGFRVELWLPLISVLLADDQRVVREGLGTLLGLLDGHRAGRHRRRRRGGDRGSPPSSTPTSC